MSRFEINKEIAKASTLPSTFYTEPGIFRESADKIFARSWQLVCREEDIANLYPATLLPGILDEPVILVSRDGKTDCFSNVCTHRGKVIVEKSCEGDLIRCGYHGRRFGLDGKCLSMPEFDGVEGFPSENDDLARLSCDSWQGFVFASPDPAAPLAEFLGPLEEKLRGFPFEDLEFRRSRVYRVRSHWALYCENYLEGFHIPYVHPALNRELDYSSYTTELFRYSSLQTGRNGERGRDADPPFAGGVEALYYYVFPNTMLNFYPWGLSVNVIVPKGPEETEVLYFTYVADDELTGEGAGADVGTVELEDQAVVESVQQGIRSRYYDRGRYSPTKETGTHHFHRLISEFLG